MIHCSMSHKSLAPILEHFEKLGEQSVRHIAPRLYGAHKYVYDALHLLGYMSLGEIIISLW